MFDGLRLHTRLFMQITESERLRLDPVYLRYELDQLVSFVRDVQESGGQATTDEECAITLKRMVLEASQLLDKLKTPLPTDKG